MVFHTILEGAKFLDDRGELNFFKTFDMSAIVRMYDIAPSKIEFIRGWQAHKVEKKWFYCHSGSFILNLIEVDNFESPSKAIQPKRFLLEAKKPSVIEISGGYATAFKAQEANSKLLVFSDSSLEDSKNDDFRFSVDTWAGEW